MTPDRKLVLIPLIQLPWLLATCSLLMTGDGVAFGSGAGVLLLISLLASVTASLFLITTPGRGQVSKQAETISVVDTSASTSFQATLDKAITELSNARAATQAQLSSLKAKEAAMQGRLAAESELHSMRASMVAPVMRRFVHACNEEDYPALMTAAKQLQFLVEPPTADGPTVTCNLIEAVDEIIVILAPQMKAAGCRICVNYNSTPTFELDRDGLQISLFNLLLSALADADNTSNLNITVSNTADSLYFTFEEDQARNFRSLEKLDFSHGARWEGHQLLYPAGISVETLSAEDTGLAALVLADDPIERQALVQRLSLLGVQCTTEFNAINIDICLTAEPDGRSFRAVAPALGKDTHIIIQGNNSLQASASYWTTNDPVSQAELAKIVTRISELRHSNRHWRILAVDDSEPHIQLLRIQLEELGHEVQTVNSARDAIEIAAADEFDLILMDLQLPDIDGLSAFRELEQQGCDTPVIAMTAHATDEERGACFEAGMQDVLVKPVRIDTLRATTSRIAGRPSRQPLAAPGGSRLPVFDAVLALQNAGGRPEIAAEMFSLLLETLPADLDAINNAVDDPGTLARAVHKLHGAVMYTGVPRLERSLRLLESAAKQDQAAQLPTLLNLVNGEVTALRSWSAENPATFETGAATGT